MKILITGSSGLIGTAISKHLAINNEILYFDLKSKQDIRNYNLINEEIKKCDGIIHLAAVSRPREAQNDHKTAEEINIEGTRNIVNEALKQKKWLIYASSREVYGEVSEFPVSESFALNPINVYGKTKLYAEQIINNSKEKGLKAATLRFSNVYGGQSDHFDRVIPLFMSSAANSNPIYIAGKDNTFDFTHISDVTIAIDKTIKNINTNLPELNICTGTGTAIDDLANMVLELNPFSNSKKIPVIKRNWDVSKFIGNHSLATKLLLWEPKIKISSGLRLYYNLINS